MANKLLQTRLCLHEISLDSIPSLTALLLTNAAYEKSNILVPVVQVALFLFVIVLAVFAKVADIKTSIAVQKFSLQRFVHLCVSQYIFLVGKWMAGKQCVTGPWAIKWRNESK